MYENPVLFLLLQDLINAAGITLVALAAVGIVAIPMACSKFHSQYLQPFSKRLFRIWFVGTANTAGSWIVLSELLNQVLLLTNEPKFNTPPRLQSTFGLILLAFAVPYLLCFVVGLRKMWRFTQTPPVKQKRSFSLKTLLIAQFVILFLCGLWVIARRGEIAHLNHMRKVIYEDAPR